MRRSLVVGKQVLDVALGHDSGFARPGSGIKSDVPVKVQSQTLAVVELNHQKSPPVKSDTAHE
jgi:hypothetical protein